LRTKSVKAMSESLGHEEYSPLLLSSYLPEPILNYFQGRWVSIFQNAMIYEAMKDSDCLFSAIDIKENELDKFLLNHGLKPLPAHIVDGQIKDLIIQENVLDTDDGIITISIPLLRLLNALVEVVDKSKEKHLLTTFALEWHEAACYICNSIHKGLVSEALMDAMVVAEATPLSHERLLGVIYA